MKKKILFLVSSMQGGGAERVAAILCNYWVTQGHEVILMPTFSGRGECVYPLDERVKIDFLADRVKIKKRSFLNRILRYFALRKAFRDIRPNVVLSFLPHVNVAALLANTGLNIPVVVSERTFPPAMPVGYVVEVLRRCTYSKATSVVVQTKQAEAWLYGCCPNARCKVIPNPVAYPLPIIKPILYPDLLIKKNRNIILAVGRLSEEKGFDQLICAFASIAHDFFDWDLVILGEGSELESLEKITLKFDLSNRVYFPGRVGNPADWYNRADIYVMSSRFEGFPNTLVESMAYGIPAISFNCKSGPADIIRNGVDGFLVEPSKGSKGLADAMTILMQSPDKRKSMGVAATDVRYRFSYDGVTGLWDEVLGLD